MMNLSNVINVVAQGNSRPTPTPNQFVDFKSLVSQSTSSPHVSHSFFIPSLSQTSLDPLSFVLEPSLCPPKLIPQRPLDLSSVSYHSAASSGFGSGVHPGDAFVEAGIAARSPNCLDDSS
ncbi:S ribonuclease [Pyrus ussuriensis x Pyrus communis]|uniref:S ribonuclease n=1 Tax=Pyrus ussuriensis x Pyrus communis TaxID=2448454 RepID=A0A5N5HMB7_9ROSA|nr:S ribonuclease [Pyrus ussuriensis x Pyrus communis]